MKQKTNEHIYLITFTWSSDKKVLCTSNDFVSVIKENDEKANKGIESIKVFDMSKDKFVKISMKDFFSVNSWNTELMQFCKYHYYFEREYKKIYGK